MKILITVIAVFVSTNSFGFEFKEAIEKLKNDKKAQEQIKNAAVKGYEYFQKKNSPEETKATEAKPETKTESKSESKTESKETEKVH